MARGKRETEHAPFVKARWFLRAGRRAVPVLVASLGMLATCSPSRAPKRPEIAEKPLQAERVEKVVPLHEHILKPTPTVRDVHLSTDLPGLTITYEMPREGQRCTNCHDFKELAPKHAKLFTDSLKRVSGLYGGGKRPPTSEILFTPLAGRPTGTEPFKNFTQVQIGEWLRAGPEEILDHENTHLLHTKADHTNTETWAYAVEYLKRGGLSKKVTPENRPILANHFTFALLARAAILSGKTAPCGLTREEQQRRFSTLQEMQKRNAGAAEINTEYARQLERYRSELNEEDVKRAGELWANAFREYKRNNLFWDAVGWSYGPHILHDVLIAQARFRKNPRAFEAYTPRQMEETGRRIDAKADEDKTGVAEYDWLNNPHHLFRDPLENHLLVDGDLNRYYAWVHRTFLMADNRINYSLVKEGELRRQATAKRAICRIIADHLRAMERELGEREEVEERLPSIGLGTRSTEYRARAARYEQAIKRNDYLNIHPD